MYQVSVEDPCLEAQMSSTKVIFTYKRKRLSSCSGVDHAEVCTEFSSDVQVDKHQDATKGRSESQEKDLKRICHGEKFSSACSSPQVLKSSISKENDHVEESDTTDTREMALVSYESSCDNTFKTSSENISASLGKTKNSSKKDMDSCSPQVDGYFLGASASQSMESPSKQDYLCHFGTGKTKLNTPLLTFSRRLKRKSDATSSVMFVELPIREGSAVKESKSGCISLCSFEVVSDKSRPVEESVDLKAVRKDPNIRNVLCHSRDEVLIHDNFVDSMDHTRGKICSKENLNVDMLPVTEHTGIKTLESIASPLLDVVETTNNLKENVRCSSNDETVVSFGDGTGKTDDHLVSHQLQASSGDSQLTTCDGWDFKLAAVRMAEQKASSGALVIDCNVIPESDLQEQASDIVHQSSIMAGTQEKDLHERHLNSKGLELFGDIRVGVDNSLLQVPKDVCASVEAETKPGVKFLQLFPEDGISDLFPPASTVSEIVRGKDERNTTCVLDSENEHLKRSSSRTSAFLGLSLPTEPLLGQTSKHFSSVQPFQDHTARTREYIQNPATHSSLPEHVKLSFRHRMLVESINKASRNISVDKFEPSPFTWAEEELDSLWIGIRRHGRGNWHAMLLDPRLHFAPWRVARDLAVQWEQELHKLLSEQHMSQGRYQKPPDSGNLDLDGDFMCPGTGSADTQLSLGDVYAQKGGSHFRMASCKVRKYSSGLFNASLDGPAMGLAPNNHFLHWLGEPIGAHSRSMEPPPPLNSTVSQMRGLWHVHPFQEPSGTTYGPRNMIGYRLSGLMAGEGRPPSGFPCAGPSKRKRGMTDNLVVIDSDASSEETISDDHNIRC